MLHLPRPRTILSRALRLRCPSCGGRPIVLSWFRLCSSCPGCGLHLDRDEPGYWIGSYTINLFATEGAFVVYLLIALVSTWPAVPWTAVLWGGILVGLATPVLLFPFTKTLYLAIDLCVRPPEPLELETPTERAVPKTANPG